MKRPGLALLFSIIFTAGSALGTHAMAGEKKNKKTSKNSTASENETYQPPYGMAGCGLGSLVVTSDTVLPQLGATILNGFSLNQSSALSCTGSSNCDLSKNDLTAVEQKVFMDVNLGSLERDMVSGEGSYLRAWAQVLGCEADGDYDAFAELSQKEYSRIFSTRNPDQVRVRYLDALRHSERLSGRCIRVFEGA